MICSSSIGAVCFYLVGQSRLRVTDILLFWLISCPSHVWKPGLRFISCFHIYRASPHINTTEPGVRSTGIFASFLTFSRWLISASAGLKCMTHDDSKEIIAIPSSKRIRSTCAQIPYIPTTRRYERAEKRISNLVQRDKRDTSTFLSQDKNSQLTKKDN